MIPFYSHWRIEREEDHEYMSKIREMFPTKEDLRRRAAGGPGPSEQRRLTLRKKRRK